MAEVLFDDGELVRSNVDLAALTGCDVLLTGASGLIGSHLLRVLSTGGGPLPRRVIAVSRSGLLPSGAVAGPNVDLLTGDLTDLEFLSSLPDVDVVIHGAGYGQPGRFLEDPLATLALNTTATIELIRKTRVGKSASRNSSRTCRPACSRTMRVIRLRSINCILDRPIRRTSGMRTRSACLRSRAAPTERSGA